MSCDSDNGPSEASSIIHSVTESMQDIPTQPETHNVSGSAASSSYVEIGGGHSAEALLWRNLAGATAVWLSFRWIAYHFISAISFLLLGFVPVLFVWSRIAYSHNRAPPPVPKLQLSDRQVHDIAQSISVQLNRALGSLYEIATGNDLQRLSILVVALIFLALFGSWFHPLTLVYLAVVARTLFPYFYEKHGDSIDQLAGSALEEINNQYRRLMQLF